MKTLLRRGNLVINIRDHPIMTYDWHHRLIRVEVAQQLQQ